MQGTTLYRSCEPVVDTFYRKYRSETPSTTTVKAIAEAAGKDPLDIPPLHDYIDPAVIEKVLDGRDREMPKTTVLYFEYEQFAVFLRGDGTIRVCDTMKPTEPTPIFKQSPK